MVCSRVNFTLLYSADILLGQLNQTCCENFSEGLSLTLVSFHLDVRHMQSPLFLALVSAFALRLLLSFRTVQLTISSALVKRNNQIICLAE
jgi:hypothetical protein